MDFSGKNYLNKGALNIALFQLIDDSNCPGEEMKNDHLCANEAFPQRRHAPLLLSSPNWVRDHGRLVRNDRSLYRDPHKTALHGGDGRTHVWCHHTHPIPEFWVNNDNVVIHLYDDEGNNMN